MKRDKNIFYRLIRSPFFWLGVIGIIALIAYSNTLYSPFVFDDVDNISNNWTIRWESITWKNFQYIFKSLNGKRPVSLITLAINYYFDGYNVIGYHIVNIIIHLMTGLFLFLLIKQLLTLYYKKEMDSLEKITPLENFTINPSSMCDQRNDLNITSGYIALFATALWLLNPIQIFSVTYTIQRMNSLSAMFSLLSILAYIKFRSIRRVEVLPSNDSESQNSTGKVKISYKRNFLYYGSIFFYVIWVVIFAILAVTSKQNAILLPLFILMVELYFIPTSGFNGKQTCFFDLPIVGSRRRYIATLKETAKFLLFKWIKNIFKYKLRVFLFLIVALILSAIFILFIYYNTAKNPWTHILSLYRGRDFTLKERLLTEPRIVLHYLSLIYYPSPSRLALLVDIVKSTSLLTPIITIWAIVANVALIAWAMLFPKKYRFLSFAILWFFIGQVLESTIIPLELIYIHRNYLPSMFLFLPIVAWLVLKYRNREKKGKSYLSKFYHIIPTLLVAVVLLFGYWTYNYNNIWKSDVTFWADNIKKFPKLGRPYANYGIALFKAGKLEEAHKIYDKTLTIKPNDPRTYFNKGVAYESEQKYKKALYCYSKALRLNKIFADAWCNQGNVLIELGDLENGTHCLYQAWEYQKSNAHTNYSLGHALLQQNNTKGAIFHLRRAEDIDSKYVDPLLDLALIYTILENKKLATQYYKKVLTLNPENKIAKLYIRLAEKTK